ncbi:cofilin-2 [Syngnathus scovelli]|uniref:cofilin-2 n=1 Tax=Syngnathus scovelli TaxID=161590 RepID=UPI00210F9E8D|nr:cofilin-2 [Syngnathus scovelli]
MTSGVNVAKEVAVLYDDIKFKKTLKVAFFRISDDKKSIIVDTENQVKWNQEDPYGTFVKMLPEDDCRYIVFDVSYVTNDSGDKTQLVFISWAPESAPISRKMVHASSKSYIKKELELSNEWSLTDKAEAGDWKDLACKLKGAVIVEGRQV